jgi:hypothetical protein
MSFCYFLGGTFLKKFEVQEFWLWTQHKPTSSGHLGHFFAIIKLKEEAMVNLLAIFLSRAPVGI